MKPPSVGSTWTARNHPVPHGEGCCPVTEDWCTRQCSFLCARVGDGAEPDGGAIDCTGSLRPHEREALYGYDDPAVWPEESDPMDLGESVPWPMGANE